MVNQSLVQALELSLFLPFAVFRNPFTFIYTQTYPLPSPSTIVGILQKSLNRFDLYDKWKKHEIDVSVKGNYQSVFTHYVRKIKGELYFDNSILNKVSRDKEPEILINSDRKPVFEQEIYSLELLIHIKTDQQLLGELRKKLSKPQSIISVGRAENIAFYLREPKFVDIQENASDQELVTLKYSTYAKPSHLKDSEKYLSLSFLEVSYAKDKDLYYSVFAGVDRPVPSQIERFYKLNFLEKGQEFFLKDLQGVEFLKIDNELEPVFWINYED